MDKGVIVLCAHPDTPHVHYLEAPYKCARCSCAGYVPAEPLSYVALNDAVEAFTAIERAVATDMLSAATIGAAATRVARLREVPTLGSSVPCELPNPEHHALAEDITKGKT